VQETQELQVQSLGGKIPWRKKWQPTPVFLPGKSHGHRSLVGYSRGSKESHITEWLSTHTLKYIQTSYGVQLGVWKPSRIQTSIYHGPEFLSVTIFLFFFKCLKFLLFLSQMLSRNWVISRILSFHKINLIALTHFFFPKTLKGIWGKAASFVKRAVKAYIFLYTHHLALLLSCSIYDFSLF